MDVIVFFSGLSQTICLDSHYTCTDTVEYMRTHPALFFYFLVILFHTVVLGKFGELIISYCSIFTKESKRRCVLSSIQYVYFTTDHSREQYNPTRAIYGNKLCFLTLIEKTS